MRHADPGRRLLIRKSVCLGQRRTNTSCACPRPAPEVAACSRSPSLKPQGVRARLGQVSPLGEHLQGCPVRSSQPAAGVTGRGVCVLGRVLLGLRGWVGGWAQLTQGTPGTTAQFLGSFQPRSAALWEVIPRKLWHRPVPRPHGNTKLGAWGCGATPTRREPGASPTGLKGGLPATSSPHTPAAQGLAHPQSRCQVRLRNSRRPCPRGDFLGNSGQKAGCPRRVSPCRGPGELADGENAAPFPGQPTSPPGSALTPTPFEPLLSRRPVHTGPAENVFNQNSARNSPADQANGLSTRSARSVSSVIS